MRAPTTTPTCRRGRQIDWVVELGVVIGRRASHVPVERFAEIEGVGRPHNPVVESGDRP